MIHAIGTDRSIIAAKEIAQQYKINFFDYSRDSFFINKPELFADFRHLNETGVELFSNEVIEKIKINEQNK
jgi:lysophospholipase L1-like esterase